MTSVAVSRSLDPVDRTGRAGLAETRADRACSWHADGHRVEFIPTALRCSSTLVACSQRVSQQETAPAEI